MALPGTPGQRISDLCNGNKIKQKELAEKIGVSASQLSRIVSGETRTVSSDILIGVAKEFKVSTDYILGLSNISVRKSYDISELGLSEGAVKGLVTGAVNVQILNRLLEHRNFPKLMDLIRIYFQDTAAKGIMARNQLIEMATASLSDLMKEHPEHRAEARQDLQFLNAQKMGDHEAEIEKIKNVFLTILRDIKKEMDSSEQPGETITATMFQTMQEAMKNHQQEPLSMDDVTAMIAGQVGQLLPMDEETAGQFQQLAKKMIELAGKEIMMLRPKEVVCKWVDAFNDHDVEAIVSLYHDNAINHQVTNEPVIGIEAIREMFTTEFTTADMTAIVENIFEDGQWAILEWRDPLGLRGCGFFHVVNGKILFQRGYWDKLSFLKQHNLPIE